MTTFTLSNALSVDQDPEAETIYYNARSNRAFYRDDQGQKVDLGSTFQAQLAGAAAQTLDQYGQHQVFFIQNHTDGLRCELFIRASEYTDLATHIDIETDQIIAKKLVEAETSFYTDCNLYEWITSAWEEKKHQVHQELKNQMHNFRDLNADGQPEAVGTPHSMIHENQSYFLSFPMRVSGA